MEPADNVGELALKYLKSDTPSKAVPYLITAARQDRYRGANESAIEHYQTAISLLPNKLEGRVSGEFFDSRIGLGKTLKFIGKYREARDLLSDVLENLKYWKEGVESSLYTYAQVETLRELADVRQRQGAFHEAMNFLETCLDHLGESTPAEIPELRQSVMDRIAWIHFRRGELLNAIASANEAIEDMDTDQAKDLDTLANLYNTLGGIYFRQGELEKAISQTELSLKWFNKLSNLRGMGVAYTNLGVLQDTNGNWPKANEYYEKAFALQKKTGDLENQATSLENMGALSLASGDYEKTRRNFETALTIREKLDDRYGIARSQAGLAQLALVEKRFADASSHAKIGLELAKAIGGKEVEVWVRWVLAVVQAETNDLQQGLETVMEACQMASDEGLYDEHIDCQRINGHLLARSGDINGAEKTLEGSLYFARKQKDPYRQGLALLELGRIYLIQSENEVTMQKQLRQKAANYLQEAISLFESLGAAHNQNQAKELLSKCLN